MDFHRQMDVDERPIHSQKSEFWQVCGNLLFHKLLGFHVVSIKDLEHEVEMFLSLQLVGISIEEYHFHLQPVLGQPHHPIHLELFLLHLDALWAPQGPIPLWWQLCQSLQQKCPTHNCGTISQCTSLVGCWIQAKRTCYACNIT